VTADRNVIKGCFSKKTNGKFPDPVSKMLEKKHGMFDLEKCDLHIIDGQETLDAVCEEIIGHIK